MCQEVPNAIFWGVLVLLGRGLYCVFLEMILKQENVKMNRLEESYCSVCTKHAQASSEREVRKTQEVEACSPSTWVSLFRARDVSEPLFISAQV